MSEFIDSQPLHGDFTPLLPNDSRQYYDVDSLYLEQAQGIVIRPAMDLKGKPVTDFDVFAERVEVFRELTTEIPSAGFMPYYGPNGGVVITEFVEGLPLNKALHSLRDKGVTKQLKSQVVKPCIELIGTAIDYYQDRIRSGRPMVIDILKSDQYVVGPTVADKRPRPKLIDHDALIVVPTNEGEYDIINRIMFTEFVICHLASLSIFMASIARSPEVNNTSLFGNSLEKVANFITWTKESGMEPRIQSRSTNLSPVDAIQRAVEYIASHDEIDNLTANLVGNVREELREERIALQRQ